jgi:hypothetical protein
MLFTNVDDKPDVTSTTSDDLRETETLDMLDPSDAVLLQLANSITDDALLQLAEDYANENNSPHKDPVVLSDIDDVIKDMQNKIDILYDLLKPQTITFHNFNDLKVSTAVTTVKDKINALFYDALIPLNWKIKITWCDKNIEPNKTVVDSVTVTVLNCHVKKRSVYLLNKYFSKLYNNKIYMYEDI